MSNAPDEKNPLRTFFVAVAATVTAGVMLGGLGAAAAALQNVARLEERVKTVEVSTTTSSSKLDVMSTQLTGVAVQLTGVQAELARMNAKLEGGRGR